MSPSKLSSSDRFLLELSDAIRLMSDPMDIEETVARKLGEHLNANRVFYADIREEKEIIFHRDYVRNGSSIAGVYPWESLASKGAFEEMKAGGTLAVDDVLHDPRIGAERDAYAAMGCAATMAVALRKDGKFIVGMVVHSDVPRHWTEEEKALLHEVASRTWSDVRRAHGEAALRRSEEKYRSLFNSVNEGVSVVEVVLNGLGAPTDFRYLETNSNFATQTGLAAAEAKTHYEITKKPVDASWLDLALATLRTGEPRRAEGHFSSQTSWHEISFARTGDPSARRLACLFRDITVRKDAEALMVEALDREQAARSLAEEATKLRDQFIDMVSHELRTPLSAILIWSKVLRRGGAVPLERALDAISASAEIQHRLIEELLDMSRIAAGKVQLALKLENVSSIVQSAVDILGPTAKARNVELQVSLPAESAVGLVDRTRLHQVLWNIVGNALKFTPKGGRVDVALHLTEKDLSIVVHDNGRGIGPEFLGYVFDRFRQADSGPTRKFEGLGLGLAIAKQFVEMHGGDITAASEGKGHGATFVVRLPKVASGLAESPVPSTNLAQRSELEGKRLLLVEDEPHTRAVLAWLLERSNAEVVAVADVIAAREAIALGATFDAFIFDLALPDEDGCTLLRTIRSMPGARTPALALTAQVRPEDQERATEAGFDRFMPKPVDPDELLESLVALLAKN